MNSTAPVYLLGAGASCDAGLPMSQGLTEKIGDLIAETEPVEQSPLGHMPEMGLLTQAYHTTRTLLEAGDVYSGRAPGLVDIERLFSAAQALATADDQEMAPFVQEWRKPFPLRHDLSEWRWFISEILNSSGGWDSAVSSAPPEPPTPSFQRVYSDLCKAIHEVLPKALTAVHPSDHDYLGPILQTPGITRIATLNYDLGVELAAKSANLLVDTGIQNWHGGLRWRWSHDESNVQLLKLHGSLGWGMATGPGDYVPPGTPRIITTDTDDVYRFMEPDAETLCPPGLVFGLRNKLRPDGPFMAMLNEFWRWLEEADRLIVIGYSFRDEHINSLILDWMHLGVERTIEIVGPDTPESWSEGSHATPWFIRSALDYVHHEAPGCPVHPQSWFDKKPRFIFHRMGAKDWLATP